MNKVNHDNDNINPWGAGPWSTGPWNLRNCVDLLVGTHMLHNIHHSKTHRSNRRL